ncbi:MAG TPA: hypothetical protein VMB85_00600 [Bryobacteraceae bacterium]|nr:hypothetical protein [Bryobacteraceae bacterium]
MRVLVTLLLSLAVSAPAQSNQPCQFQVIAGPPSNSAGDGGPAASAYLLQPNGISLDSSGNLYIADTQNNKIRVVYANGTIATFAGDGTGGNSGDGGSAVSAQLSLPEGVLAAPDGSVYVSDTGNNRIRRIGPDGTIQAFAGGHSGYSGDGGPALAAELSGPVGLALGPDGSLYIADTVNNVIRRVDPTGTITTVAGNQSGGPIGMCSLATNSACYSGDGGPATSARLNAPNGLAVGADGSLYIADTLNGVIRKVDPSGTITTVAGTPFPTRVVTYPQLALQAYLGEPNNVAILSDGSLLIASNNDAYQLTTGGVVNLYAQGVVIDNTVDSSFFGAVDSNGVVYLSDGPNNIVWKLTQPLGSLTNFAGQLYYGLGTEGGPATGPNLDEPQGMTVAADGSVYVADALNHRVRKISPDGTIRTVAGTGVRGFSGDGGPATSAQLDYPGGVAVDASGNIYIADTWNEAIREVSPDGTISTLASVLHGGVSLENFGHFPRNVVVDSSGNLYVWMDMPESSPVIIELSGSAPPETLVSVNLALEGQAGPYAGLGLDASGDLLYMLYGGVWKYNPTTKAQSGLASGAATLSAQNSYGAFGVTPSGQVFVGNGVWIKQQVGANFPTLFNRDLSQYLGVPIASAISYSTTSNIVSMAADARGNLYIADRDLHRIRELPAGSCQGIAGPAPGTPVNSATLTIPNNQFTESFAPGELVTIKGAGLGPSTGVGPVLDPNTGLVPTILAGTQVLFDGVPAPILYSSDGQINAIVPFTIYGRLTSKVTVEYNGVPSDAFTISLSPTDPKVFSITPQDPIVVNADGTLNSATNPAQAGSYVIFYMSGLGLTNPPGTDGHIAASPLPAPLIPLTASPPFTVLYAGDAPGIVEGVIQVNLQLPNTAQTGVVQLQTGSASTTVSIYIQ